MLAPNKIFRWNSPGCQTCPVIQEGCSLANANDARSFKNFWRAYCGNVMNEVVIVDVATKSMLAGHKQNFVKDLTWCKNHTFGLQIRARQYLKQIFRLSSEEAHEDDLFVATPIIYRGQEVYFHHREELYWQYKQGLLISNDLIKRGADVDLDKFSSNTA